MFHTERTEQTNTAVEKAGDALYQFQCGVPNADYENVIELFLLALMHYCDRMDRPFHILLADAQKHYAAHKAG
jgi:hypothetical protein